MKTRSAPAKGFKPKPWLFFLLFSLFTAPISLFGQTPDWSDFYQRKAVYPNHSYFTGHVMISVEKGENPDEKIEKARSGARAEATQTIQTTVRSLSEHKTTELNMKIFDEYRQSVSVFSDLTVQGMKVEVFYDTKKRNAEAFAYIKKGELLESNFKLYQVNSKQLETKIAEAERYKADGQSARALEAYQHCLPLVRELQQNLVLVIICGGDIAGKLPSDYEGQITSAIASVEKSPVGNLHDLCERFAITLKKQLAGNSRTVLITPLTYEDTRMGSPLSGRLLPLMEQQMSGAGMAVTAVAGKESSQLVLTGGYWESETALTFTVTIRHAESGKPLASATGELPLSWFSANGIAWKPENFTEALARQKMMSKDEIIGGGLMLDVWTNKGDENLLFIQDEIMKISVRANHPCYLRLIYYMTDGTKTLLDEFTIPGDQVNKVITLPRNYRCSPPFGAEMLQVVAQNVEFMPLRVRDQDGYKIIMENTEGILANVRSFKVDNDQKLFAEKRLTITTIAR